MFSVMDMETSEKIHRLVAEKRIRRGEIIEKTGANKSTVSTWFSGISKPSALYINKLCALLECDPDWLLDDLATYPEPKGYRVSENVINYMPVHEKIPLISWVRAGSWDDPTDNYHPGDAEAWVPSPPSCNPAMTFALVVTGESMDDGTMQGYRDGELIYVDGSRINPEHNADVIVRNGDGKVTFKRLVLSNGDWYLKPLNPNWPEKIIQMDDASHIVGRVVFSGKVRI